MKWLIIWHRKYEEENINNEIMAVAISMKRYQLSAGAPLKLAAGVAMAAGAWHGAGSISVWRSKQPAPA